ncbi:outer membrane protein [Bartonella machadoae]|uniref:outer membrane protein n=1 Tax=Bartonella machadoae TaxID=2893471 RepID=UPI001F4C9B10|nr:outer membrane beta-barrel protein [Bartonella machadoae]UNE54605.1 outer membrane beta-barrel protein [Bartonella machadoae]
MNTKRLITASVFALISASTTQAADVMIPHQSTPVSSPALVVPTFTWSGFYLGGQVGGFSSKTDMSIDMSIIGEHKTTPLSKDLSPKLSGFEGGIYAGSNIDLGDNFVFGIDTDFIWSGQKHTKSITLGASNNDGVDDIVSRSRRSSELRSESAQPAAAPAKPAPAQPAAAPAKPAPAQPAAAPAKPAPAQPAAAPAKPAPAQPAAAPAKPAPAQPAAAPAKPAPAQPAAAPAKPAPAQPAAAPAKPAPAQPAATPAKPAPAQPAAAPAKPVVSSTQGQNTQHTQQEVNSLSKQLQELGRSSESSVNKASRASNGVSAKSGSNSHGAQNSGGHGSHGVSSGSHAHGGAHHGVSANPHSSANPHASNPHGGKRGSGHSAQATQAVNENSSSVYGIEQIKKRVSALGWGRNGEELTISHTLKQNWAGATRVRIGFAADRFMPYVAGGIAYTQLQDTTSILEYGSGISSKTDEKKTMIGYTLAGGVDFAILDNVIVRAEYRYSDFGKKKFANEALEISYKTNDFRVGVAYKF